MRLMYVHVPTAILAFVGLLHHHRRLGHVAAAAQRGLVGARRRGGRGRPGVHRVCLLTGSIWGRPTWGTYWDWDPRITSTTLLFILLVGYLALRRIDNETGDAAQRGMRGAIVGLLLFPNVMIVHYSVDWWRSLHQTATITRLDPTIEGTMLFTLMLGIVVFGLAVRLAARAPLPRRLARGARRCHRARRRARRAPGRGRRAPSPAGGSA